MRVWDRPHLFVALCINAFTEQCQDYSVKIIPHSNINSSAFKLIYDIEKNGQHYFLIFF
jgi:hypothetical protein